MFIYNISYKYQSQILKVCMQPYKIAYTANGISHFGGALTMCTPISALQGFACLRDDAPTL